MFQSDKTYFRYFFIPDSKFKSCKMTQIYQVSKLKVIVQFQIERFKNLDDIPLKF